MLILFSQSAIGWPDVVMLVSLVSVLLVFIAWQTRSGTDAIAGTGFTGRITVVTEINYSDPCKPFSVQETLEFQNGLLTSLAPESETFIERF